MKKIIFGKNGYVGKITLNNPKRLNSLDLEMVKELSNLIKKIKKSSLKAVVITGAGNSFCSGGDIAWELKVSRMPKYKAKKELLFVQKTISSIESLPQVTIALINGYAVGGGNELAMACDIRIALPEAKFIHPEASLGTVAPLGATKRLPRLVGIGRAKYILLTGEKIDSKTALEWGLADFIVPEKDSGRFLDSMLAKLAINPKKSMELTKKSVNKDYLRDLTDKSEIEYYVECSRTKENRRKLEEFLRKRPT